MNYVIREVTINDCLAISRLMTQLLNTQLSQLEMGRKALMYLGKPEIHNWS